MANLLEVENLRTYFFTRHGVVKAVDGVGFAIEPGKSLGLVGESGCGKTITTLSVVRLVPQPAGRIVGGKILFEGENLLDKSEKEMRQIRGRKVAMIMQDPMRSLDPCFRIGNQVGEAITAHEKLTRRELRRKVQDNLTFVGISSASLRMRQYPHQMSGGMRQRIVGAIGISCRPSLLIADEPTTALDVTIQAQYLEFLKQTQRELGMAMILVTHDFGIVAAMCDHVAVMYAGRIVERAETNALFEHPYHPYTIGLINALPRLESRAESLASIDGQPPSLANLSDGCRFAPRCRSSNGKCLSAYPPQTEIVHDHFVSCWLAN
jgi:oligopeptide/dipeptide ABC transporter ATP-binding protein